MTMIRFNNDYNHAAMTCVLDALARDAHAAHPGYGLDTWCRRAEGLIREKCAAPHAEVHFLVGGTQANAIVISAALRPYESVVCAGSGHINVHETGAVEATGHKVQALPSVDGKISADQVRVCAEEFRTSCVPEHITEPKMVYLSFPTEFGTLYSLDELEAMRAACDEYGLYLFVDGARLGYGLGSPQNDVELSDLARLTDVFYIGGTKCGALFGEAVVICNPALQGHFRSFVKRGGGMLAKGWLAGLQFCALLEDDAYFDATKRATAQAMRIRDAFAAAGIRAYIDSPTNQQFVLVSEAQAAQLAEEFVFEPEGRTEDGLQIIRFCTSWSTTDSEVDALVDAIARL